MRSTVVGTGWCGIEGRASARRGAPSADDAGTHIDRERWAELSLLGQLANIAAEVGRAVVARRAKNDERFEGALARAIDLFDATLETLPPEEMHRRREIELQRDDFVRIVTAPELDVAEAARIEQYFHGFALEYRRRR